MPSTASVPRSGSAPRLARVALVAFWTYVVALVIQAAHFFEHIAQIHQLVWLANPRPQGLFGAVFDFAWVHFAYNAGIFVAIVWCYALWLSNRGVWRPSRWGSFWFHSLVVFQGYHVVEHTVQMYQYYRYGLLVPPGIIGKFVPNVIAHFDINGIMTLQMLVVLLVFRPSPRPYGPPDGRAGKGHGFRAGVLGSGAVAVLLVALIVAFANSAPAATVIPLARQHCLGEAPAGPATVDPGWRLQDVAGEANLSHVVARELPPMGRLGIASAVIKKPTTQTHPSDSLTGAIAVADADDDGWPDVYVADVGQDALFRNRGDGTFEEVARAAGIVEDATGRMALWFDADGDGDRDLFVANFGAPHRLWRNDGNWTFTDATEASGLAASSTAYGAAAVDVDGDGDLDLSVANYGAWHLHVAENNADAHNGEQDMLYVNQGDGTFVDEARERGLVETLWTFSHAWADFDRDGDQDLYHNNDFGIDRLYVNDGAGRFRDAAADLGVFTDGNGMGAEWVDYDGDGDLDVFATAIYVACNRDVPQFKGNDLFRNDGPAGFAHVPGAAGMADGGWAWDGEWLDLDHDGDLDNVQANGYSTRGEVDRYHDALTYLADDAPATLTERNQGEQPSTAFQKYNATKYVVWSFYPPLSKGQVDDSSQGGHQVDRVWINDGGRFRDAARAVGLTEWTDSRAFATIDFDRDGDLDLLRTAWHRHIELFANPTVEARDGRHWLQVGLEGPPGNRDGLGAIVVAEAGGRTLVRTVGASGGFLSQSEGGAHFGLGEAAVVDALVVHWPDGGVTRLDGVPADRRIVVARGAVP